MRKGTIGINKMHEKRELRIERGKKKAAAKQARLDRVEKKRWF